MSGHNVVTVSVTLAFDGILGSVAALGAGSDERPGKGQFHFSGDLSLLGWNGWERWVSSV